MKTIISTGLLVLATTCLLEGHVYITQPLTEFPVGTAKSHWVAQFDKPWSGTFRTGEEWWTVAQQKGYKNLREYLEDKGPVCGYSLPSAAPKSIPSDGMIKLASTIEHHGRCEIWLNDNLVWYDVDCKTRLNDQTEFKVDFSKCGGSCMLRFYWLGLQNSGKLWQSYKNCIPLKGNPGGKLRLRM